MAKKNDEIKPEIVETEPVVIEEKDIITEELPAEEVIEVEAPEVKFKLKIEIAFCDKYTGVDYEAGDVVEFEKDRYDELLKDERKLVSKVGGV